MELTKKEKKFIANTLIEKLANLIQSMNNDNDLIDYIEEANRIKIILNKLKK
jgi:hypothetical protein